MIIAHEFDDTGLTILETGSRLTGENSHELLKLIYTISQPMTPHVIVNLQQTTIVDGAGIGALIRGMKYIKKLNGRFAICNVDPELKRTLQKMNLHVIIDTYDSLELAKEQLENSTPPRS
jgi:anti-anti-sigma factor